MPLPISAQSKEYVKVSVSAFDETGVINPTSDTVQFAFLAQDVAPTAGTTWNNGTWETDTLYGKTVYKARALIGPSTAFVLTAGTYDVWIKITHGQEVVMRMAGTVLVI